jgi:hypothetical protein
VAVASKDVKPYHVYVVFPAMSVGLMPSAPEQGMVLGTAGARPAR